MIKFEETRYRLTFVEPILGTTPGDKEIYHNYVASKAPDEETCNQEYDDFATEDTEEKGMTFFSRDYDGNPFLYDYQIKGFFKGTCGFLRKVSGSESSKIKAYKKTLDGLLFINERKVPLHLSGDLTTCQRPLRASTMQGDRVALASSEQAPAGTWIEFTVRVLDKSLKPFVTEALEYGVMSGIGQWRNSGMGRFTFEVIE